MSEIEKLKLHVEALEYTVCTLISWLGRDLGDDGIKQLFAMLEARKSSDFNNTTEN